MSKQHGIAVPVGSVHISTYPVNLYKTFSKKKEKKEAKGDPDPGQPGFVDACILDKSGKVDNPGAYCASIHDKVTGTTKWRGKKEAISATSQTAQLRPVKKKECFKFREANNSPFKNHTFEVILLEEGMGNFKDCFFYTKAALKNAVSSQLFEGLQCFADHPNQIEEEIHPERSTRDILGYYENVRYEESDDGTGRLVSDLCVANSMSLDWAMALLTNSIDYKKKFRETELIGLSINASGAAYPVDIDTYLGTEKLSQPIIAKLNQAKAEGISEINVVNELTEAKSVDLVTKAGAGGKILSLIESALGGKNMSKKRKRFYEADPDADAHAMAPGSDGEPDHADADQDKALFAKMIKQYLGKDSADPEEEAYAKSAYEEYKKEGMSNEEAYMAAGKHLKMAMALGKKLAGHDEEKHEEAHQEEEEEKHEEAHQGEEEEEAHQEEEEDQVPPPKPKSSKPEAPSPTGEGRKKEAMYIRLSGEVAKLRESLKTYELKDYLDKKMRESGRSNQFTKKFREALGKPRSKEQIEQMWKIFLKAADAGVEEVDSGSSGLLAEKTYRESSSSQSGMLDLSDCLR